MTGVYLLFELFVTNAVPFMVGLAKISFGISLDLSMVGLHVGFSVFIASI
jgi:hypothetical protein